MTCAVLPEACVRGGGWGEPCTCRAGSWSGENWSLEVGSDVTAVLVR
jgi:hypothetical protein